MPPPVFDAVQLIAWVHAGIARQRPRYAHTDLW
jgi:hypothetical protein